jgi:hypothetical protein
MIELAGVNPAADRTAAPARCDIVKKEWQLLKTRTLGLDRDLFICP